VCALLRTKWDETWSIIQKAVSCGKALKSNDPLPRIGIDDKAFRKGQSYITLIYNLDQSNVEAISDGNDTEAANAVFSQLSEEQLGSVQAIAMDMSAAYVKSAKANIPLAEEKMVHDRFHIMKMANEAVDKVRKTEHCELKEDGDNRLTGTKFLWLTGTGNLSESQRKRFDAVNTQQLKTERAWGY
jgi:transposase